MEDQTSNLDLVSDLRNGAINQSPTSLRLRPYWLSPIAYLLIVLAISLILSLAVLVLFRGEENENTWILATTSFGIFFVIAIVSREVVLRRAQTSYLLQYNSFERSPFIRKKIRSRKFTLDENNAVLELIQKKSKEAFAIQSTASNHFEVFEMCQKYLEIVAAELKVIRPGSPRLLALKNGQKSVSKLHKEHLLSWAAEETRNLTKEAAMHSALKDKLGLAERALGILNSALLKYPKEAKLIDSVLAIEEFIISVRVAYWVELAERAAYKKHFRRAINYYQNALFYLDHGADTKRLEYETTNARLNEEIKRLRKIAKLKSK